ncbi:MAG: 16S rRNA (guanine(966)-N(2))-methyltransferase RsmD [Rhodospirillales bacterium 20-64-7]|nr:MAG: 16S rRNA (guanine(966)-N(2))-methyltransferase RsmD [Rhodospirillales bacterium 20-64-7]HQT78718.1 16S rRNA (guanine(966)-N(2))-methyltransferase RsmD [Rhodopila sp.]
MRIVGGAWRGRRLAAPAGQATRPTADRVRQALFDMLLHAPWGGRAVIEDAVVLDAFAGTGALGLEALSRGAASACFIENDPAALKALRANVTTCGAEGRAAIIAGNLLEQGARGGAGLPAGLGAAGLVFLDPPYGQDLVPRAVRHLRQTGRIVAGALVVAETAAGETWLPEEPVLAERRHGAARVVIFRVA